MVSSLSLLNFFTLLTLLVQLANAKSIIHCNNNGSVVYEDDKMFCDCPSPFTGRYCEDVACVNGLATGAQYDSESRFFNKRCLCDPGWIGDLCDKSLINRCGDNGKEDKGKCICQSNFVGDRCEYVTKCTHGQLYNGRCACHYGWAGDFCDKIICHQGSPNETNTGCLCPSKYRGKYCDFCAEPSSSPPPECARVSGRHIELEEDNFAIIIIAVVAIILIIVVIVLFLRCNKSKKADTKHARQATQNSQGTNSANENQPLHGGNVVAQDAFDSGKFSDAPPPYEAVAQNHKNQSTTVKVENEHDSDASTEASQKQRENHEQSEEAHATNSDKNKKYSSPINRRVTFSEEARAHGVEVNNETNDEQQKQRDDERSMSMTTEKEGTVEEPSSHTEKNHLKDEKEAEEFEDTVEEDSDHTHRNNKELKKIDNSAPEGHLGHNVLFLVSEEQQ